MNPDQITDHDPLFDFRAPTLTGGDEPGADAMRFDPSAGDDELAAWDEILHPRRAS